MGIDGFLAGTCASSGRAREVSQFYHAPWIDSIRSTTLGGLVLGFGFKLSDLVCYCVGVFVGYALSVLFIGKELDGSHKID